MKKSRALALVPVCALALAAVASVAAAQNASLPSIDRKTSPGVLTASDALSAPAASECTDGTQVDDGTFEDGFTVRNTGDARLVQRLPLTATPARLSRACVCWVTNGDPDISYDLVVYAADGTGGRPGTLLGSVPVTATGVSSTHPTFFGYDLSALDLAIQSDAVYIGARWSSLADPDLFLCGDLSGSTPAAAIWASSDGATWATLQSKAPDAKAVGVRAVFDADGCIPDEDTLCLHNGRFKVEATYETPEGETGAARVEKLTEQTGYLYFFDAANVEAVVKVLDGCGANNRFWVFAGGLTNVRTVITVTDTRTDNRRTYTNPQGRPFQPIQDTNAFPTCSQ